MSWRSSLGTAVLVCAGGCAATGDELRGLAEQPPLDCAVLLTGGAFLAAAGIAEATFGGEGGTAAEVIPIEAVRDVLARGRVFHRIDIDADAENRERTSRILRARAPDAAFGAFLSRARDDGYDYLLVVEQLQDGAIERQGTNGTWPVTFATWILLGVGALIPDRTFESRATLRVTLRDLHTGRVVHDPLQSAGPVDLSLVERTDFLGLLLSIVVPPFWVGDDPEAVRESVVATTRRRLLLSLARNLKSEVGRQRLRDNLPAQLSLAATPTGFTVTVRSAEALSVARLRAPQLPADVADAFAAALLGSVQPFAEGFRYSAALPAAASGRPLQVLVGTLRGDVASATFVPGGTP